jgi:hypothetical protein
MTVDLPSLETDAARDVDGREAGGNARGVGAFEGGNEAKAVMGGFAATSVVPLLLRLMMVVSSFLNRSRSVYAIGWGEVKVKLWPVSSSTRPSFSLTCAAPSLLQNRAVQRPTW